MNQSFKILVNTPHSGFKAYSVKTSYVYIFLGLTIVLLILSVLTFTAFWYQKNRVRSLETELSLIQTARNVGLNNGTAPSPSSDPDEPLEELNSEESAAEGQSNENTSTHSSAETDTKSENGVVIAPAANDQAGTTPNEAPALKVTSEQNKLAKTLPGTRQFLSSLWQDVQLMSATDTIKSSPLQIKILKFSAQNSKAQISLSISAKQPEAEPYKGYLMYLWQSPNALYFEPQNIFWEHNQLLWDYRLGQSYTIKRVKLVNLEFPLSASHNKQQLSLLIIGFDNNGKIHYLEKKDWNQLNQREKL